MHIRTTCVGLTFLDVICLQMKHYQHVDQHVKIILSHVATNRNYGDVVKQNILMVTFQNIRRPLLLEILLICANIFQVNRFVKTNSLRKLVKKYLFARLQ